MSPLAVDDVIAVSGQDLRGWVGGMAAVLIAADDDDAPSRDLGAEGKTVSVVTRDRERLSLIAAKDMVRSDAVDGVARLRALGVRVTMLTGDTLAAAPPLARDLGIVVRAGLCPEDKLAEVRALQAEGLRVAKVGDGINDAPALAAADVGITFGGGGCRHHLWRRRMSASPLAAAPTWRWKPPMPPACTG